MALETNELHNKVTRGDQLRLFPADHGITPKDFAAVAGGKSLVQGTLVVINTSTELWGVYDQGAANGTGIIGGILMEEGVLNDSGSDNTETLLNVMTLGILHRDDVNTAAIRALLIGTPSEANIDTALRHPLTRQKGLIVEGLAKIQ